MKKRIIFQALFIIISVCSTLQAQIVNDTIKGGELSDVEISANTRPSVSRSTTPLQIVDNDKIMRESMQSLADAVRTFNGIVLKDYGGIGGLKTVSIRGLGAEHTAVSYDGIMLSNILAGQIDIGRYSLDNISFVSLSIGQSDGIFQTAKSFASGGTINLQTTIPRFDNHNYRGHARITTGSFGLFNPMLDYSRKLNSKFVLSANGSWERADGAYRFSSKNDQLLPDRKRRNNDINTYRTEANLFGDFGDTGQLRFKAYFYDSERGIPGGVIIGNDNTDIERLWDKNFFSQVSFQRNLGAKLKWKSNAKYDYSYSHYENQTANRIQYYKQHEAYFSNSLLYTITDKISASFAEDLFYQKLNSENNKLNDNLPYPKRYNSLSALALQYQSERFTIVGNLLATYISEKTKNQNKNTIYKRLTPSISASVKPFDFTNLRIRASYKNGFRVPTFSETYYTNIPKPLEPERAKQFNLGLTWAGNIGQQYINISVDGFHNKVDDKIIIRPISPIQVSAMNLGNVEMTGVDVKIASQIKITELINIDCSTSYSYMHAIDVTEGVKNYKDQIMYTPQHSGGVSIGLNNPIVNFSYSAIASGHRYSMNQNILDNRLPGYTDHSISLFKTMKLKSNDLYMQGSLLNIWDKSYDVISFYPMPGRSFRISLGYKF